jgi:hypothetical protein
MRENIRFLVFWAWLASIYNRWSSNAVKFHRHLLRASYELAAVPDTSCTETKGLMMQKSQRQRFNNGQSSYTQDTAEVHGKVLCPAWEFL